MSVINMSENSLTMDTAGMAVFYLSEIGPDLLYHDFIKLPEAHLRIEDVETFLLNMAHSYIGALSFGNQFFEGVFDLPAGHLQKYRSLVISVNVPDMSQKDVHLQVGYVQLVLFIPMELAKKLPSTANFQDELIKLIKKQVPKPENVSQKVFVEMKPLILDYLTTLMKSP